MNQVTQLLEAASRGDPQAAASILPLVYDELKKLAASRLAAERPDHTLNATALVHEAYLKLVGDQQFNGSNHFFGAASEAMRRILVDHARQKLAQKRGGQSIRVDLGDFEGSDPDSRLIALDEALNRLREIDPIAADLVNLRYFAGFTIDKSAELLYISTRTANRLWVFAKAWLYRELS